MNNTTAAVWLTGAIAVIAAATLGASAWILNDHTAANDGQVAVLLAWAGSIIAALVTLVQMMMGIHSSLNSRLDEAVQAAHLAGRNEERQAQQGRPPLLPCLLVLLAIAGDGRAQAPRVAERQTTPACLGDLLFPRRAAAAERQADELRRIGDELRLLREVIALRGQQAPAPPVIVMPQQPQQQQIVQPWPTPQTPIAAPGAPIIQLPAPGAPIIQLPAPGPPLIQILQPGPPLIQIQQPQAPRIEILPPGSGPAVPQAPATPIAPPAAPLTPESVPEIPLPAPGSPSASLGRPPTEYQRYTRCYGRATYALSPPVTGGRR